MRFNMTSVMGKKKYLIAAATVFLLSSFGFVLLHHWEITGEHIIKFEGKYAHGVFEKLSGSIVFDPDNLAASKFDVEVDVNSINTGNELKNKHAKSEKWFDAERYPVIRFVSSDISRLDSGYIVRGDLQLHGIARQISIPFVFLRDTGKPVFKGSFKVNRGDFGIGKTSGKESDSTAIELSVPVVAR